MEMKVKVKLPKNIDAPRNFTHGKEYLVTSRIGSIFMIDDDDGNECGVIADNGGNDMSGCAFLGCKAKWVIVDESVSETEKTFGITQHEWSDKAARAMFLPETNKLCFEGEIRKQDAIAIAKHFKLTAEDLK